MNTKSINRDWLGELTKLIGERRPTLAEANAEGYFTKRQIAERAGVTSDFALKRIKAQQAGGLVDVVKIRMSGAPEAYRVKRPASNRNTPR